MKKLLILGVVAAVLGGVLIVPPPFKVATQIDNEIEIGRPPVAVFEYITTAGNWPKWHPSSLAVPGAVDHPLALGNRATEDFRVAGREGCVEWTVVAREGPMTTAGLPAKCATPWRPRRAALTSTGA